MFNPCLKMLSWVKENYKNNNIILDPIKNINDLIPRMSIENVFI